MRHWLFSLLLFMFFTPAASAQIYKWADADGRVHYSNVQPPPSAKIMVTKKLGANTDDNQPSSSAINKTAKKNTILLYISAACGEPCIKAQALLDQRGVSYTLKNTDKDKKAIKNPADLERLPILIAGSQPAYKGLVENDWQHLIDNLGYAKRKFAEFGNNISSNTSAPVSTSQNQTSTANRGKDSQRFYPANTAPNPTNSALSSRCDGRTHCSQMKSCEEAKYFLKNCPGTEMDGDGDGTPCEKQWCNRLFN